MRKSRKAYKPVVRLHFAIAHYFDANGNGRHGSLSPDPEPRSKALREVILQLHRLFGGPCGELNHQKRRVDIIKTDTTNLKISVCVTKEMHLLKELEDLEERKAFTRINCLPKDPKHLGFQCHRILEREYLEFDYNCFMEDDILITNADYFKKLKHFNKSFGDTYLLQPNRIETSLDLKNLRRFYIDGDYNPPSTENYRKSMNTILCMNHLGENIRFIQRVNTHSGCFFLNQKQSQVYFNSRDWEIEDTSFHGPLESAATLGVMKQFQIFKPALSNGEFLTVEHAGRNFMGMIQ